MPQKTLYQDGDNKQLRDAIFKATPKAIAQTTQIAQQFKGKTELDTCKNIFNFLKNKITYVADGHHQKVKLPSALLRERVGDCKSYSLFTAAVLKNLGISCKYVLTSYQQDPTPTHIYVQTSSGIIIDAVYGVFNAEKPAMHKFYQGINGINNDMKISYIAGINSVSGRDGMAGNCSNDGVGLIGDCGCSSDQGVNGFGDWLKKKKSQLTNWATEKAKKTTNWVKSLNIKQVTLSPIRGFYKIMLQQNVGGWASTTQNSKPALIMLQKKFTDMGGDGRDVTKYVQEGSGKAPKFKWAMNYLTNPLVKKINAKAEENRKKAEALKKSLEKSGMNGIGQLTSSLFPAYTDKPLLGMKYKDGVPHMINGITGEEAEKEADPKKNTEKEPVSIDMSAEDVKAVMDAEGYDAKVKKLLRILSPAIGTALGSVVPAIGNIIGLIGGSAMGELLILAYDWIKELIVEDVSDPANQVREAQSMSEAEAKSKVEGLLRLQGMKIPATTIEVNVLGKKQTINVPAKTISSDDIKSTAKNIYDGLSEEGKYNFASASYSAGYGKKWGFPDYDSLYDNTGGGTLQAGFGGLILPLLIGGGVIMALNTAKKQR
jgi:hypothetical protein